MRFTVLLAFPLFFVATAHAALFVETERRDAFIVYPEVQRIPLEIFFRETAVAENERLASFRLKLELSNASPDGVHFALPPGPPSNAHPPVFPGVEFRDLGSDFNTIFVSAALPAGGEVDVNPIRNGILTATVEIPANVTPAGVHLVTFDLAEFGFFDTNGAPVRALPGQPGGVFTPEPSTGVIAVAAFGVLALRRRRP